MAAEGDSFSESRTQGTCRPAAEKGGRHPGNFGTLTRREVPVPLFQQAAILLPFASVVPCDHHAPRDEVCGFLRGLTVAPPNACRAAADCFFELSMLRRQRFVWLTPHRREVHRRIGGLPIRSGEFP